MYEKVQIAQKWGRKKKRERPKGPFAFFFSISHIFLDPYLFLPSLRPPQSLYTFSPIRDRDRQPEPECRFTESAWCSLSRPSFSYFDNFYDYIFIKLSFHWRLVNFAKFYDSRSQSWNSRQFVVEYREKLVEYNNECLSDSITLDSKSIVKRCAHLFTRLAKRFIEFDRQNCEKFPESNLILMNEKIASNLDCHSTVVVVVEGIDLALLIWKVRISVIFEELISE